MKPQNPTRQIVAFLIAAALYSAPASAGLTHRYTFNETTVKDSVGKVDGKHKGAGASIADGKLVLKNDVGSNDEKISYVEFDGPIMPKSGSVTLVIWFTAKEIGSYARLVNIGAHEGGEGNAFLYVTPHTADGSARAAMTATDVGGRIFVDNPALDDDKPHMMAVVVDDKAKKLQVFIDGKEASPATELGENTLDKIKQVDNWLGRSSFDADPGLSASIDEFRVYDHPITADEAAAMQKAGPNALPPATQPGR